MQFSHFIPTIHLGPTKGSSILISLPLESISELIIGNECKLEVNINIFADRKNILSEKKILEYFNEEWVNKSGEHFNWKNQLKDEKLNYIETHIDIISGKVNDSFLPGFYVFYSSNKNKTYLSCGAWKYGNPRVILQMVEFGCWIDGYPSVNIDKELNTTYSAVIINPYNRTTNIDIEIPELDILNSVKVSPKSVKKIDFSTLINKNKWLGQVYLYGSQRAIIYFISHKINNFSDIATIEHPDPFRAEKTKQPRFQKYRSNLHDYLLKLNQG